MSFKQCLETFNYNKYEIIGRELGIIHVGYAHTGIICLKFLKYKRS